MVATNSGPPSFGTSGTPKLAKKLHKQEITPEVTGCGAPCEEVRTSHQPDKQSPTTRKCCPMQPKKSANTFSNGLDGGSEYVTVSAGCDRALTMQSLQFLSVQSMSYVIRSQSTKAPGQALTSNTP